MTLKQKDKWLLCETDGNKGKRIRKRSPKFSLLEEALWTWCLGALNDHIFLMDRILLEKAGLIAALLDITNEGFQTIW